MPYGSWDVEIYGLAQPSLVCWALSDIPPGPWDAVDLLPFLLPYVAPTLRIDEDGEWYQSDPLLSYPSVARFQHPDGHGPLTIVAVALVWLTDPPTLSSAPTPVTPITTLSPGWVAEIPLYRTILASHLEG